MTFLSPKQQQQSNKGIKTQQATIALRAIVARQST